MKNKKILLALALISILSVCLFTLTGCSSDTEDVKTPTTPSTQSTQSTPSSSQGSTTSSNDNSSSDILELPMTVYNGYTNVTMKELYLSGAGLDSWGDDILEGTSINPGESVDVVLNVDADNVKWDIYVVDEDGTEIEFRDLDLSNVSQSGGTITLTADDDGNPVATAE